MTGTLTCGHTSCAKGRYSGSELQRISRSALASAVLFGFDDLEAGAAEEVQREVRSGRAHLHVAALQQEYSRRVSCLGGMAGSALTDLLEGFGQAELREAEQCQFRVVGAVSKGFPFRSG